MLILFLYQFVFNSCDYDYQNVRMAPIVNGWQLVMAQIKFLIVDLTLSIRSVDIYLPFAHVFAISA